MKKTLFFMVFFICLIFSGCATGPEITKLTGVWKYESYSNIYLDKLMIVGKPQNEANRKQFEDYLTQALQKRKIEVTPSYKAIPDMKDLNRESIKQAAIAAGIKAVLVTKVVGIDEQNVIFQQTSQYQYTATSHGMSMRVYTFQDQRVGKMTKVRLETGLFEVESEKLLWGGTSAIMNPETADEAIRDFSKAIIQQLNKDLFLP
jgi:hypothetical protein